MNRQFPPEIWLEIMRHLQYDDRKALSKALGWTDIPRFKLSTHRSNLEFGKIHYMEDASPLNERGFLLYSRTHVCLTTQKQYRWRTASHVAGDCVDFDCVPVNPRQPYLSFKKYDDETYWRVFRLMENSWSRLGEFSYINQSKRKLEEHMELLNK